MAISSLRSAAEMCTVCQFEPKIRSKKPPTLRQAVRWIAQLGGFLARTGDGKPGVKTLWRGIGVLHHLLEGAQLAPKT